MKKQGLFLILIINIFILLFIIYSINFLDIINYLPLSPLIFLLFREMLWIKKLNPNKLKIMLFDQYFAFIQNHNIWMCIFEAPINENIRLDKLLHLTFLKNFSIEFNKNESIVDIRIFTTSLEEINLLMKKSRPILERIFPDIQLLESDILIAKINEYKILKINNEYFFHFKTYFIFPLITQDKIETIDYSSMILTCQKDSKSNELHGNIIYIKLFVKKTPFLFLKEFILTYGQLAPKKIINKDLLRIRLKSPLKDCSGVPIEKTFENISLYLQKENNYSFAIEKKSKSKIQCQETKKLIDIPSSEENFIRLNESKLSATTNNHIQNLPNRNQICFELCSIFNDFTLTEEKKLEKCVRKSEFCKKIIEKENFELIIREILNLRQTSEFDYLCEELTQHISSQQLVCVLAHLSQEPYQKFPQNDLLLFLYSLIKHLIGSQLKRGKEHIKQSIPLKESLEKSEIAEII